jgi:hypothetical protein
MSQVIIYTNSEGNISVCMPTGELSIKEVLIKDCPKGAVIVDDSTLPQGKDRQFFDAWELNGTTITVNIEKAKAIKLTQFNDVALQTAQKRQLNTLTGIVNTPDDATFLDELNNSRNAILNAKTTADLI